jgi:hypothetical protein
MTISLSDRITLNRTKLLHGLFCYLSFPKMPSNNNGNYSKGIVLFAHGSGSSRHSSRNKYVVEVLQKDGLVTVLIDLLTTKKEEADTKAQKINYKIPGLVLNISTLISLQIGLYQLRIGFWKILIPKFF